jgi:hypothetical protein
MVFSIVAQSNPLDHNFYKLEFALYQQAFV